MSQTNFEEFQELVEQFEQEMSLKAICEQEGVSYRTYIAWRKNHGLGKPRKKKSVPTGLVEVEVEGVPRPVALYNVSVRISPNPNWSQSLTDPVSDQGLEAALKYRPADKGTFAI